MSAEAADGETRSQRIESTVKKRVFGRKTIRRSIHPCSVAGLKRITNFKLHRLAKSGKRKRYEFMVPAQGGQRRPEIGSRQRFEAGRGFGGRAPVLVGVAVFGANFLAKHEIAGGQVADLEHLIVLGPFPTFRMPAGGFR
ncbi:MAG TPA: hypothetical protein VFV23_01445 [Verrucomicrobiae bacterium]|nr:hypothetical protein [Verrucomicrobiae bacterium]